MLIDICVKNIQYYKGPTEYSWVRTLLVGGGYALVVDCLNCSMLCEYTMEIPIVESHVPFIVLFLIMFAADQIKPKQRKQEQANWRAGCTLTI